MRSTRATDGIYVEGTGYENYINTTIDGFRIYLFDRNNKFILRFIPMMLTPSGGELSDTYTVVAKVPAKLESLTEFKVVVLANWLTYSDTALIEGESTIDDLCNAEWSLFNCLINHELNPDNVIPFYGIHHYIGVSFVKGKRTTLPESVSLLRAMAKIEVIFDNPGLSLSDVILHGLNSKGYCAPTGVYSQADYDHNKQWNEDYVKSLHLIGNVNDMDATVNQTHLLCKNPGDGTQPETWVCYVPEYKNTVNGEGTGAATDKAYLELKLDIDDITLENVYFTEYSNNNPDNLYKSVPGTDFDLHRNNVYRFNVSIGKGGLIINVKKWENAYDNRFVFL